MLFFTMMLNFSLMSVSYSFEMSSRCLFAIPIFAFLSFKVIFATINWWSLLMSAFLITHTS